MYITNEDDFEILKNIILQKKYFRNQGQDFKGQCSIFEENFAKIIGTKYSLMVTSGTNALICALTALNLTSEDEIIIPSFTFFATAVAVVKAGGKPIIVNIDNSHMIDPSEVKKAITKKTKAIIAVHMDGHPADMDSLVQIANENKLILIEDVAQATGGSYKGARLGSIGDIGCFSFNVDKIISCGEGGAIVTNSRKFYEIALCVQDACCSFGPTFKNSFTEIKPFLGSSMRVSEISGALMNVQLSRLDYILETLRANKKIMESIFNENDIYFVPSNDPIGDCATSFYLNFNNIEDCQKAILKLAADKIVAIAINMRPAHACWQWMHLIETNIEYKKSSFLESINILMSTLKINIPFDMNQNELKSYSRKIISILKSN